MKKIGTIAIISLLFTISSPFIFKNYVEKKPDNLNRSFAFGAPFPYAVQQFNLPDENSNYPAEVPFQAPLKQNTTIKPIPLLFTFLSYFLISLSVYSIATSYFKKEPKKKKRA